MQLNSVFREWLHRRKITDSIIEEFGIHGMNEIVIPIRTPDGLFTFNKYRRSPESLTLPKYRYDKGSKVALYGADMIEDSVIVITEGELDSLVCRSHNICAVSSTGGAMSFQKEWLNLLEGKKVIVCFDNDETGGKGMQRLWQVNKELWFVFLPDRPGVKDISDYVTNGGDLHELLKTAQQFPTDASVKEDRGGRMALWKSVYFHDAVIDELCKMEIEPRPKRALPARFGTEIERAKKYPIDSLIEFKKGYALCLWHTEDTPSLCHRKKINKAKCYGKCDKYFDSIDIYRQLHNCSFTDAVSALQ